MQRRQRAALLFLFFGEEHKWIQIFKRLPAGIRICENFVTM